MFNMYVILMLDWGLNDLMRFWDRQMHGNACGNLSLNLFGGRFPALSIREPGIRVMTEP